MDQIYGNLLIKKDGISSVQVVSSLRESDKTDYLSLLSGNQFDVFSRFACDEVLEYQELNRSTTDLTCRDISSLEVSCELLASSSLFELNKLRLKYRDRLESIPSSHLSMIKSYLKSSKVSCISELFIYLEYLHLYADYLYDINEVEKSLCTLYLGLSVLSEFDQTSKYSYAYDRLCAKVITTYAKETDTSKYLAATRSFGSMVSDDFLSSFEGILISSYIAGIDSTNAVPKEGLFAKVNPLKLSGYDRMMLLWNQGVDRELSGDDDFVKYYRSALSEVNCKCRVEYFQLLLYIISSGKGLPSDHKLLNDVTKCDERVRDYVNFISPNILSGNLSHSDALSTCLFYQKAREYADKLYGNLASLHLQDYYGNNYTNLVESLIGQRLDYSSVMHDVMQVCYDTRRRDSYRQHLRSQGSRSKEQQPDRTATLMLELQRFTNYFPEKSGLYKEYFDAFTNSDYDTLANFQKEVLDLNSLGKKLTESKSIVINVLKGAEFYSVYSYDGYSFELMQYKSDELDRELTTISNSLREKYLPQSMDIPAVLASWTKKDYEGLIFISDGSFSQIPLSIFMDIDIQYYPTLKSFLYAEYIEIDKSDIFLYSYSDQNLISSEKKLVYPELVSSFQEVVAIFDAIGGGLVANANQYNELYDSSSVSLLHLSTHAFSSKASRLDNYFLVKDQNSDPVKQYGFSLYREQTLPPVVVLSACDTGFGVHTNGAGVQTLSRAFLENGSKTVIKTLWKVNEKATAEFMVKMYTYWATGISLYDALALTQKDFREHKEYSHPYYWSGFVLEGNPNVYLQSDSIK